MCASSIDVLKPSFWCLSGPASLQHRHPLPAKLTCSIAQFERGLSEGLPSQGLVHPSGGASHIIDIIGLSREVLSCLRVLSGTGIALCLRVMP